MDEKKVREICQKALKHFEKNNIHVFKGMDKPLICISHSYPGVWLEHVGDSVVYAEMFPEKGLEIAVNTLKTFIDLQKNGQYPCYIWDDALSKAILKKNNIGYGQIQECVSFGSLCLRVCKLAKDDGLLRLCYESVKNWVNWIKKYRMTTGRGLPEMFVGFDTGHDNSGRLEGMRYPENRRRFFAIANAALPPKADDKVAPICAVDMSACLFGNLTSLAKMAEMLKLPSEKARWQGESAAVKAAMLKYLWNEKDAFFYDIDKYGNQRKYLSCAILTLFQEGVLDKESDKDLIDKLLSRHILCPNEFWTPYPFPSMAISDSSAKTHKTYNDWGYFTQGNTVLRTSYWMDAYGLTAEQNAVCTAWLTAWTATFDTFPIGQELDPLTGEHSPSSPWYSTGILFYLWSAKHLGIF